MKEFPILISYEGTAGPCPRSIPWDVIAPYGRQAEVNHSQTLERLAERGGLSPVEAWLVMHGKTWQGETFTKEREKEACAFLDKIVKDRSELVAERDALKLQVGELLVALRHMKVCGACAEDSWETCQGGRDALEAMAKAEGAVKRTEEPPKTK